MKVDLLCRGYGLIEGPVWDPARGLYFSDVLGGGVFLVDRKGVVSTVFEHRRGIGGMALHVAGGLVVSGRNVSFKPFGDGETKLILDRDPDGGNVGYNDLTTDAAGRIYVGSLGSSPVFQDGLPPRAGDLWMVDLDGSSKIVAPDVRLTNGLGFAPDGKTLYHSDSRRQCVFRYPVKADGTLGPRATFVELKSGVPDGLVVSTDGAVWVAVAAGGKGVRVFDASGREKDFVEIPDPQCTSVCFGGDDLKDLYIVSGSEGGGSEKSGAVYRARVGVAGVPVARARVRLK